MSAAGDAMARLIPWYVNGSLSADERREFEQHLEHCAECRDLLAHARACAEVPEPDKLEDHIQSQLLLEFAEDTGSLDPSVVAAITGHLDGCDVCRQACRIVREIPQSLSGNLEAPSFDEPQVASSPAKPSWWRSAWNFLGGTLLQPGPALAYLLIAGVLAVPAYRAMIATDASVSAAALPSAALLGSPISLSGEATLRGEGGGSAPAPIPAEGPVLLELRTDIDDWLRSADGAVLVVELREDRPGDSTDPLLRIPMSRVKPDGSVSVLVFPERFAGGEATLQLRLESSGHPMDGRVLYARRLEVTGHGATNRDAQPE